MNRTIAVLLVAGFGLAGCQSNNDGNIKPTPSSVPSVTKSQTTKPVEPSKKPTTQAPEPTEPTTRNPEPGPVASTTEAGTPATQFAQRWGLRYPSVPEYAILKAAKGTCLLIEQGGADWFSDPVVMGGVEEIITGFGMEKNQALEFAQDADQNYCSSIANPT